MKKVKITKAATKYAAVIAGIAILTVSLGGCAAKTSSKKLDLNNMSLSDITKQAKAEGQVQSVGMPDDWANWKETWQDITSKYGVKHTDADMSSTEELALFESEKNKPTKDIGDIGQAFGPMAISKDLLLSYKTQYWNEIPDWAKDKDGYWADGYYGSISFMTNLSSVKNPPKTWQDILSGNYKVSIGDVTKAAQSQCAVLACAYAMGGSESNIQPAINFFSKLASQGRLDLGDVTMARMEKGDVQVVIGWDFLALGDRALLKSQNSNVNYDVTIPSDGSVKSGYAEVINEYAPHPAAAALARNYILSDEGQINLARGFARPIRSDVKLPADVKAGLLPDSEYTSVKPISNYSAWSKTVESLPELWQEQVLSKAKS